MEQTAHATLNASEVLILVVRTSVVLWCTALSFAAWRWPVGARWPIRYQLAAWFVIRLCGLVFLVFFLVEVVLDLFLELLDLFLVVP